jgi:ribonuclease HI
MWSHRENAARGGMAILVRRDIQHQQFELPQFSRGANLEFQSVKINTALGWIAIGNFYNPGKNVSHEEISFYLSRLGEKFVAVGDFNAHSPLWDARGRTNFTGRSMEAAIEALSLCLLNDGSFPTYIDNRCGTTSCLDLAVLSPTLSTQAILTQGPDLGSDHFPICCKIGIKTVKSSEKTPVRWKLYQANWPRYQQLLNETLVDSKCGPEDANSASIFLTNSILKAASMSVPRSSGQRHCRFSTPWWDGECSRAVALRRRAKGRLWRSPTPANLIDYKRCEAVARNLKIKKQRNSWAEYISTISSSTTTAEVWRKIRSIQGRPINSFSYPLHGAAHDDDLAKANLFSGHFAPVDHTTEHQGGEAAVSEVIKAISGLKLYNCVPFTENEFSLALKTLKNTAPGHDSIMNIFFKRATLLCKRELLSLLNTSWNSGLVPDAWKQGTIIPIPKPGKSLEQPTGYRPITLLPCMGKLLERMVLRRLEYALESKSVIPSLHLGFRKGKSTIDALHLLKNAIISARTSHEYCLVVYLDIEGAFDSVWPDGLLFKLHRIGVGDQMLAWLYSYFKNRSVQVRVGNSKSMSQPMKVGVPQGAVLSPTLFNVMLHDLPRSPHVTLVGYADDITLFVNGPSMAEARHHMQQCLDEISEWCNRWQFRLNPAKCTYQIFTSHRTAPATTLKVCNRNIQYMACQKVLGVYFDSPHLTFREHIRVIRTACLKRLQVLRALSSVKWGASRQLLRRIYVAFMRSKMEYGSTIFWDISKSLMRALETMQNSALRCIQGARRTTPIVSLQVEGFVAPLELRFLYLFIKWVIRYLYMPAGDSVPNILGFSDQGTYGNTPFVIRAQESFHKLGITLPRRAASPMLSPIPPQVDLASSILLNVKDNFLNNMPEQCIQNCFTDFWRKRYPKHFQIYTDGSKSADGSVAAGFYVPSTQLATGWLLRRVHTVLGAELFAILKAMQLAIDDTLLKEEPVLILTDSRSALNILTSTSGRSHRTIVFKIHKLMLIKGLDKVVLCWIRGHSGIHGNEVADKVANLAHSNNRTARSQVCFEEWICTIKTLINQEWVRRWSAEVQETGKGIFRWSLGPAITYVDYGMLPRPVECAVSRLRMGHAGVDAHLARFNMADSSNCSACGVEGTVSHFILHCTQFTEQRRDFRTRMEGLSLPWDLTSALGGGDIPAGSRTTVIRHLGRYLLNCNMVTRL